MADIRVKTGGSATSPYDTWAKAQPTMAGAIAVAAAGDRLLVGSTHSEAPASSTTYTFPGTMAAPLQVISVDETVEPPVYLAGASVATTGSANLTLAGNIVTAGMFWAVSSGTGFMGSGVAVQEHLDCSFHVLGAGSSASWRVNGSNSSGVLKGRLVNSSFRFSNAGQKLTLNSADVELIGGGLHSSGTSPTGFCQGIAAAGSFLRARGFDFSAASAGMHLFLTSTTPVDAEFTNCRLPASWSGALYQSTPPFCAQYVMANTDNAATNYRYLKSTAAGTVAHSTAIYVDDWAGGTPFSYRFQSLSSSNFALNKLRGPDMAVAIDTVGSPVTAYVDIISDNLTFTDEEAYLEVEFMSSSSTPVSSTVSDAKSNLLATPANQDSSSRSWTTTGLVTPVKQRLSVTFTPETAGYAVGRVVFCKPSSSCYADAELRIL